MSALNRCRAIAVRPMLDRFEGVREPHEVGEFVHCAECVRESKAFATVNVALTERGVQAWCVRHDVHVAHFAFHTPAGDS